MKAGVLAAMTGLVVGITCAGWAQDPPSSTAAGLTGYRSLFSGILSLESASDPKCYATASRLEDFVYGTPLSDAARFVKNDWVKRLAALLLRQRGQGEAGVLVLPEIEAQADGRWEVRPAGGEVIVVAARDRRQYASIAYSLRALLAAQQEALLSEAPGALPVLEPDAVEQLKATLDVLQLAVLQMADRKARGRNEASVSDDTLREAWHSLGLPMVDADAGAVGAPVVGKEPTLAEAFAVLREIIGRKVAAYAAYNQISNQLFVRNLQVYFARRRWPSEADAGAKLKSYITQAIVNFAVDLYSGADAQAGGRGDQLVREQDVNAHAQRFVPHRIDAYEDALFFPDLDRSRQVTLESYDMDAFRDSGLHWRYLEFALEDPAFTATRGADPFAAELLAENIAQFGVLLLRIAGEHAMRADEERLSAAHIESALRDIQGRIDAHGKVIPRADAPEAIVSSAEGAAAGAGVPAGALFREVAVEMGIRFSHRSSDWLNRQLRSYLKTGRDTGTVTIPPAFGGAGIAAEDVNHDGWPDLLILSGLGNRLYLNQGGQRFVDTTGASGIGWLRPDDNRPGEPRQPVIADFDNDGHQDILITYVNDAHRLYKGRGDGTFEDVTERCGLGGRGLVGGPATTFDYDRDGRLDLFVGYFGDYLNGILPTLERRNRNGLPDKLFRNVGDMRFEEVENAGVEDVGWGQAAGHTDFDGDGWQDLIVGNDFGVNGYYRNNGNGTFTEMSAALGTDKPSYTMGIGIADLNRDQLPDIYISNIVTMNKDQKYVLPNRDTPQVFDPDKLANMRVVEANDLFLSSRAEDGGTVFGRSNLVDRGYSSTGWSWDADFFDVDNDGDDDLFVLNGMNEFNLYSSENPYYTDPLQDVEVEVEIAQSNADRNVLFVNEGGRLQNRSAGSGLDVVSNARSAAYLDFDGDGDLDVAMNDYHGPVRLFRNSSADGKRWLKLRLEGDPAAGVSRDAIGARIRVDGKGVMGIWREVHGTIGYLSVHPKQVHIGVGQEEAVAVEVLWPDGKVDRFPDVTTNGVYLLKQGGDLERTAAE